MTMSVEAYNYDVTLHVPREKVIEVLSDPFLFSGISGHVEIVRVYDSTVQDFVEPAKAKSPASRFKVIYVYQLKDERALATVGELSGPTFTPNGVSYSGFTEDGKLKWSLNIEVKGITDAETQVKFTSTAECEESFFGKLLSKQKNCGEVLGMVIRGHIIPYLVSFLRPTPSAKLQVTPTLVYTETGTLSEVMPKVFRSIQDVHYGIVIILGENVRGKLLIDEGNVVEMNVTMGLETITDVSEILRLLNSRSGAKVYVYSVNIEEQVKEVLDQVYDQLMKKELFEPS